MMKKHFNCKPIKSNVDVKETIKVAEITDPYGNLRYKVTLISHNDNSTGKYKLAYTIQVILYFGVPSPVTIVERPEQTEAAIYDYNYAIKIYCDYVKSYTNLVKAETKDHQTIDIYKENIGYEKTNPTCCSTCKWSKRIVTKNDYVYGVTGKLQCVNPINCKAYEKNIINQDDIIHVNYNKLCGHKCGHNEYSHDIIYPIVDPFGVCEHYFKAVRNQVPVPGQSITNFIDMRIGDQLNDRISAAVEQEVSEEIGGNLTDQINNAVSDALENTEILKEPIQNALQEDEISQQIVDIVSDNIVIGSITGNKGVKKFTDLNNNGIQDFNEPDEPDNEEIVILGDMGA